MNTKTFFTAIFTALFAGAVYAVCPGGDAQNDYIVKSYGCRAPASGSGCAAPLSYRQYWDTLSGSGCGLASFTSSVNDPFTKQELLVMGAFPHDKAVFANNSAVNCRAAVDPDGNGQDAQGYYVAFVTSAVDEL